MLAWLGNLTNDKENEMNNQEYAKKLVYEAKETGEAVSDIDSTVVYFKDGKWIVTDNGEAGETSDYATAISMVVENLDGNA